MWYNAAMRYSLAATAAILAMVPPHAVTASPDVAHACQVTCLPPLGAALAACEAGDVLARPLCRSAAHDVYLACWNRCGR